VNVFIIGCLNPRDGRQPQPAEAAEPQPQPAADLVTETRPRDPEDPMSARDKITIRRNWIVAQNSGFRSDIVSATYRQALTYANKMRRLGAVHVLPRPILAEYQY